MIKKLQDWMELVQELLAILPILGWELQEN
jgi:hypothetical protein